MLILFVFLLYSNFSCLSWTFQLVKKSKISVAISMTSNGYDFLNRKEQNIYFNSIVQQSSTSVRNCIQDKASLIEIAFPESRKSDISVTESLTINRDYTFELLKSFSNYGNDVWVLFPDRKESFLASETKSGKAASFRLTSIDAVLGAYTSASTTYPSSFSIKEVKPPKLLVAVNPGFNVEEWIKLQKIYTQLNTFYPSADITYLVINGNLDRLRNGYYPAIFYPELNKISQSFYKKFIPAYLLRPVAIGGDRLATWLVKSYPNENWQLLVKNGQNTEYIVGRTYQEEPPAQTLWKQAKDSYFEQRKGTLL
jgi:hypothetical protein